MPIIEYPYRYSDGQPVMVGDEVEGIGNMSGVNIQGIQGKVYGNFHRGYCGIYFQPPFDNQIGTMSWNVMYNQLRLMRRGQ